MEDGAWIAELGKALSRRFLLILLFLPLIVPVVLFFRWIFSDEAGKSKNVLVRGTRGILNIAGFLYLGFFLVILVVIVVGGLIAWANWAFS